MDATDACNIYEHVSMYNRSFIFITKIENKQQDFYTVLKLD